MMATNLHALIRYRTIDRCLRKVDKVWRWQELGQACSEALFQQMHIDRSISRRTIMSDIKNMRSGKLGYYAPIEYDRKEKSYYYSDSKFSIDHIPVKKEELEELNTALLILKQFIGKVSVKGIESIVTKLEETLKIRRGKRKEIIQFEQSLNEPGQQWVNQIYESIKNGTALNVLYKPFDKEAYSRIISPYLLKEYNNRWFLFGYEHKYNCVGHLALDRIKEIKYSLQSYYKDKSFDPEAYLKDILGVTFPEQKIKQEIVFKAYGTQRHYIRTKPIHVSQQTLEMETAYAVYKIQVMVNYELVSKLLSYGETIEVLQPKGLRALMKSRLKKNLDLYKS